MTRESPLDRRRSGILLHPTSLPDGPGNGDLGASAYRFADFLAQCGCSVWQVLPLGPTHGDGSPYHSLSAHAGNPYLVALEPLVEAGWLDEVPAARRGDSAPELRQWALERAYASFRDHGSSDGHRAFAEFTRAESAWLEDYALFTALREEHCGPWWEWPAPLRDRDPGALDEARDRLERAVDRQRFFQWLFFSQWRALKDYANGLGILLFGDMPIFVAHDSAEVWAHRQYFALDGQGHPETVAGVPPDYFSETGQCWGNPHFRWDRLAADGYGWWIDRLRSQLGLFDWVRIDHFRGFEAFWEIPAGSPATEGHWVEGPGAAFFQAMQEALGELPLVAEDLGLITPAVTALRERFGLPGMKVLQFAFGDDSRNPFLPHNHGSDYVVYTGTHDNNTTLGWLRDELDEETRERVRDYLGHPAESMPWPLIRAALASVAQCSVIPFQDFLALGSEHRMNQPGTTEGNWQWRFDWDWVDPNLAPFVRHLNDLYGRLERD